MGGRELQYEYETGMNLAQKWIWNMVWPILWFPSVWLRSGLVALAVVPWSQLSSSVSTKTIKIVFLLCIYIYIFNSCYWHLICQDGLESDKVVIEHGESHPLHIKHRPETNDFSPHFGDLGHLLWGNWQWFCRWPSIHGTVPLCRRANANAWTLQLLRTFHTCWLVGGDMKFHVFHNFILGNVFFLFLRVWA